MVKIDIIFPKKRNKNKEYGKNRYHDMSKKINKN